MAGRKPRTPDDLPDWADRPIVVLRGGQRDGRWYFADDLAALARSYAAMGEEWPYVETSATEPHPHYRRVLATVHRAKDPS